MINTIKVLVRKEASLNRRQYQTARLTKQADKAYEVKHLELYEAYEECINFQQDKMIELTGEIIELRTIIKNKEDLNGKYNSINSNY